MTGPVPPAARASVDFYRLQRGSPVDASYLPLVRELALLGDPRTPDAALRHCRAAAGLVAYHLRLGLPVDRATVLRQESVTWHLTALAATRQDHSVRIHAVALGRMLLADRPPPPGQAAPDPNVPYSPGDVQGLLHWAGSAADPAVRHGLLAVLAFGLGAGLGAADLHGLDGPDVALGPDGAVLVTVRTPAPPGGGRAVPVLRPYERLAADLARAAGAGWVLRPEGTPDGPRGWKALVAAGHPDPRLPALNPRRCRRTWLHTHLEGGTPPVELMRAAGIAWVNSLVKPTLRLPPLPATDRDAELRAGG